MVAYKVFILSILVVLSQNAFTLGIDDSSENTKRLLLNDQDVAGQINRNIQSLTQLVNTMKIEMAAMKNTQTTEVTDLEAKIAALEAKVSAQKAEVAVLKADVAAQKADVAVQKAEVARLNATISNAGSTYIRWGRTSCSAPNTQLVYKGYAAGQHYYQYSNHYGGPANFLCLPNDPELSNLTTANHSFLWGTEFQENLLKPDAVDEDVPCAVCKSTNTHVSIMIPGRQSCYRGWKAEYNGLLASDHYGDTASSYICVDRHPEYVPGGERNDNGRLLYFTSIKCGALSCPPYKDGKAVNCVVCSQ